MAEYNMNKITIKLVYLHNTKLSFKNKGVTKNTKKFIFLCFNWSNVIYILRKNYTVSSKKIGV